MSPTKLISDPSHKVRFYELLDIFQFADNWNDPRITWHVTRMYARKAFVKSATRLYTEALIDELRADPNAPPYIIRSLSDSQVMIGMQAEYSCASKIFTSVLNN